MLPGKEAAILHRVVGKVCLICWPLSQVLKSVREQSIWEKSIPGPSSSKYKGLEGLKPVCAAKWLIYVPLTWNYHLLLCVDISIQTPLSRGHLTPSSPKPKKVSLRESVGTSPSLCVHASPPEQWPPLIRVMNTRQTSCYRETHPLTAPQLYPTAPTGTGG